MVPTRDTIQAKIDEAKEDDKNQRDELSSWLDDIECPPNDKEKIMGDLISYANYN